MTIILLILPTNIWAQQASTAEDCSILDNKNERLACYDFLYRPSTKSATTKETGDWNIRIDTSKFDDSKSVYLNLSNTNIIHDRFGNEKTIMLLLRCNENTTSLFIVFNTFMSDHAGGGRVEYRLDKNPKKLFQWQNPLTIRLWDYGEAIDQYHS